MLRRARGLICHDPAISRSSCSVMTTRFLSPFRRPSISKVPTRSPARFASSQGGLSLDRSFDSDWNQGRSCQLLIALHTKLSVVVSSRKTSRSYGSRRLTLSIAAKRTTGGPSVPTSASADSWPMTQLASTETSTTVASSRRIIPTYLSVTLDCRFWRRSGDSSSSRSR